MSRDHFRPDSLDPPASAGWQSVRPAGTPRECFADEIAIDFPSVDLAVERMREAFGEGGEHEGHVLATELRLSSQDAWRGVVVPLEVPIRATCPRCGGRGESWTEPCGRCYGTGAATVHHAVKVSVPARVADGTRLRFRISSPHAAAVRVEIRVAIRPAA